MNGLYIVGSRRNGAPPDPDSLGRRQLAASRPFARRHQVAFGQWSGEGIGRIHVVDVETGQIRMPIFDGPSTGDWAPAWSPDGERMVFNRLVSGGEEGLVVAAAGGGPVVEIGPRFPAYSGGAKAEFSPDGRTIIATYNQAGVVGEVDLLDPAGGSRQVAVDHRRYGGDYARLAP